MHTDTRHHEHVRTSCGRDLTIGRLALGDAAHPAARVFVDMGTCQENAGSAWAGLTTDEARLLAGALLAQVAEAEAAAGSPQTAAEPPPQKARADGTSPPGHLTVRHAGGDKYTITARGHTVVVDQPVVDGGTDTAVTPTELLAGSLASCVAFYAGRYLRRHGIERSGLAVTTDFTMAADRPARVSAVRLTITVPPGFPAERAGALLAVASHCTVHNTLRTEPEVVIRLG